MLSKCKVGLLLRTQAISYLSKYICRKAPRSETTRTFKGDGRGMVTVEVLEDWGIHMGTSWPGLCGGERTQVPRGHGTIATSEVGKSFLN